MFIPQLWIGREKLTEASRVDVHADEVPRVPCALIGRILHCSLFGTCGLRPRRSTNFCRLFLGRESHPWSTCAWGQSYARVPMEFKPWAIEAVEKRELARDPTWEYSRARKMGTFLFFKKWGHS